jgi:hypothetical protein
MKYKAIISLGWLVFFCSCRSPRPALIPEISPLLIQENVFAWKGQLAGDLIFPCAAGIGWVDAAGKIITWNAEQKAAGPIIDLPFPVNDPPFRQGDFLVLKEPNTDHLLVFDLGELKVRFELRDLNVRQVLAANSDCLVYLDNEGLVVYSWKKPDGIFRLPVKGEKFFNCEFFADRILILSQESLFIFWKKDRKFQQLALPLPAASPFYCDGEHMYYGSSQRYLVKYSTRKEWLVWKLQLGQVLERRPFAFAGAIVANPQDNNVLFLNERGSLIWWLALQSTVHFDLLPMSENLAAVLLNRDIKFINFSQKKVVVLKSPSQPASRPLVLGHDLYFMQRDGERLVLQRLGNQYGVALELEPSLIRWPGQSVRFSIQPLNLLEPSWECVIRDAQGLSVFSKTMKTSARTQLAWIPLQPGKYTIQVAARALQRNEKNEATFEVLEPRKIVPEIYWHF